MNAHSARFSLAGQAALVIGGTSGIGLEIAIGLHQAGARVGIVGRSPDKLAGAVRHLELVVSQERFGRPSFLRVQWWDGAKHAGAFEKGMRLDLVIEPGLDRFRGAVEPNARLVDLRVAAAESRR